MKRKVSQEWRDALAMTAGWSNVREQEQKVLLRNIIKLEQGHKARTSKHSHGRKTDKRHNWGRTSALGLRRAVTKAINRQLIEDGLYEDDE